MSFCKLIASCSLFKQSLCLNRQSNFNMQIMTLKRSTKEKLAEMNIPEKPKRPLTPYFKFLQEQRKALAQTEPKLNNREVFIKLAAQWRALEGPQKDKYTANYDQERQAFNSKLLAYSENLTSEQSQLIKEAAKEKRETRKRNKMRQEMRDNNKPKKPAGAYMLFLMEKAKNSNKNYKELMKDLAGVWKELPAEEKKPFMDAFEANKKKYDAELAQWEAKMIKEGKIDLLRKSALEPKLSSPLVQSPSSPPKTKKSKDE